MWIYFLIFVIILVIYIQMSKDAKNVIFLAIIMTFLGLFVGVSDMLGGYDRYIYAELFDSMADVTRSGGSPWTSNAFQFYGGEFGWGSLCALISYITNNRYIFIFIVTIIIYTLLFFSFKDYTSNYSFAVLLFLGLWFFFTFTYLRQVLSAATAWLAIRYISRRDLKHFLLVWFIAYSFHNSALVILPMYFLPIKKYSETSILYIMGASLLIGLTPIPTTLFQIYGAMDEQRVNVDILAAEGSFRISYFIEAVFFLYLILSQYKRIPKKPKTIVLMNMALVFCAILLVFIRSDNGGRLGWFYMIGCISTVTFICHLKYNSQLRIAMLLISFYLYFRILSAWTTTLSPYKTFFTNGVRPHDGMHYLYEYDSNYDEDKFYRL